MAVRPASRPESTTKDPATAISRRAEDYRKSIEHNRLSRKTEEDNPLVKFVPTAKIETVAEKASKVKFANWTRKPTRRERRRETTDSFKYAKALSVEDHLQKVGARSKVFLEGLGFSHSPLTKAERESRGFAQRARFYLDVGHVIGGDVSEAAPSLHKKAANKSLTGRR